jgi:hypothetical protein
MSRGVRWALGLGVLGVLDLVVTIHARLDWHPAPGNDQAVLTLGQLMGFVSSAALILIAATIVVVSWREARARRRYERLSGYEGDPGPGITTW